MHPAPISSSVNFNPAQCIIYPDENSSSISRLKHFLISQIYADNEMQKWKTSKDESSIRKFIIFRDFYLCERRKQRKETH